MTAGAAEPGASPSEAEPKLRLAMLSAERRAVIGERNAGRIDDEVLRSLLHDIDLEEAAAASSTPALNRG